MMARVIAARARTGVEYSRTRMPYNESHFTGRTAMKQDVLTTFNIDPSRLIGEGGEVWAYELDEMRVLRIYKGTSPEYLEILQRFYAALPPNAMHRIALPEVLSYGQAGETAFSVDKRLPGQDFGKALKYLQGQDRRRALTNFVNTAAEIQYIPIPHEPSFFGEILAESPTRARTWPEYLWRRARYTYAYSEPSLREDVPGIDSVMTHMRLELEQIEPGPGKLVHGDYYPPNTYINDRLEICALGDFGRQCVIGDPMTDIATTVIFLEFSDGYRPEDILFLRALLTERYGDGIDHLLSTYKLYYAIYYSFSKYYDPPLYKWCTDYLRQVALTEIP